MKKEKKCNISYYTNYLLVVSSFLSKSIVIFSRVEAREETSVGFVHWP